jgi:thioredoxin reductase (NADPH)
MQRANEAVDLLVVGAGPVGLACAIEAGRVGLRARVVEKGALVNSLTGYPTAMEFFSTPELLRIGGHPFPTARYKPVREEAIDYYRGVTAAERLDVRLYEKVESIDGEAGAFEVRTDRGSHPTRHVVIATGFFDQPCRLEVAGEDLPHVSHYYREPYAYTGLDVVVIGAKNSAAKAALDLFRHGARTTLVARGEGVSPSVKYWIRPDIENRIAEGSIAARFGARVSAIGQGWVDIESPAGRERLSAARVLALTGYRPDFAFLEQAGVRLVGDERAPDFNPDTMETNRAGVYVAGTVCGGAATSRWFIENGRVHAVMIAAHAAGLPVPHLEAKEQP